MWNYISGTATSWKLGNDYITIKYLQSQYIIDYIILFKEPSDSTTINVSKSIWNFP